MVSRAEKRKGSVRIEPSSAAARKKSGCCERTKHSKIKGGESRHRKSYRERRFQHQGQEGGQKTEKPFDAAGLLSLCSDLLTPQMQLFPKCSLYLLHPASEIALQTSDLKPR